MSDNNNNAYKNSYNKQFDIHPTNEYDQQGESNSDRDAQHTKHSSQQDAQTQTNQSETSDLYHQEVAKAIYAGFGIRFFSFIIDLLVLFGVGAFVLSPIYAFTHIDEAKLWIDYFSIGHLIDALLFYLYFVLMTKYFKQTIGKMIFNIRVERIDRKTLKWSDVLFREWIGRIICGVFACLPYLVVIFTPQHRGIHDYFADTVVIKNKLEKLFYEKK
ncbi:MULTISPECIES: RDD family protein [Staphylococcus]|uniref:RDD family protein n=1 Tax=Staphylococcus hsinchuensis TaxID=3051183 RepID=A0ABZ3EDC7_9STAP|nr:MULTISPECIES: RDD family protein [unclassified Staphylococcus]